MTREQWRITFEVVGLVSLVSSLLFVGLQLSQDRTIARAELGSQGFNDIQEIHGILTGREFANTWAKVIEGADDFAVSEMVQVNHLLSRAITVFNKDCYGRAVGVFDECQRLMAHLVPHLFGNRYAQTWWTASKSRWPSNIAALIDLEIQKQKPDADLQYIEEIRSNL